MLAGENLTASVLSVGITAAPISTGSDGPATSGTTESFDTTLGYYQATLISGHQYRAILDGAMGNGTVVGDLFNIFIRDSGSSSAPTTSSTQIAHSRWYCAVTGTNGRTTIALAMPFTASSSGVHTFGVSAARVNGSGTFNLVNTRALFVVDLGGN